MARIFHEQAEERVRFLTLNVNFGEQWKSDPVVKGAEFVNLILLALLPKKIVGRETAHDQSFSMVTLMQFL